MQHNACSCAPLAISSSADPEQRLVDATLITEGDKKSELPMIRKITCLIYPLCKVIAALQRCRNLSGVHGCVLRKVFGVLPFEEFDTILGVGSASEVAIGRSLLVFRLA